MPYALADPERRALAELLRGNTLIALDYDGTLAPIAPRPEDALLPEPTRQLLNRLARRRPVVVLTGRSRMDALRFLAGVAVIEVIGSHGVETAGSPLTRFLSRVEGWRLELRDRLHSLAGVRLEDKRYSLAVHYRQAPDPGAARAAISAAVQDLRGARIVTGKKVLNVVPEEAPDKGAALLAACDRLGCDRAVFVGDDDTDESAFAAGERVIGIRVGPSLRSAARHYLHAQDEIDALLQLFLEADREVAPGRLHKR
jgi:trehalose 6-phosphate phosphatase